MQDLKVALVQTNQFWEDKAANYSHFEAHLKNVAPDTDLIILPEMFNTGFSMNVSVLAEKMDGNAINWLKEKAKKHDAAIVASLIIEENNDFFNRMVFIEPTGEVSHYDKIKLFGIAKENHYYSPGKEKKIISYKGWKILLQVCYDLRFPELARNKINESGKANYDLLLYVANWPEKRNLHWKSLLQARAIENQVYVVAVNRVGTDKNQLSYSGDSSVISPLGEIEKIVEYDEKVINTALNAKKIKETREKLPFLKDI